MKRREWRERGSKKKLKIIVHLLICNARVDERTLDMESL